MEPNTLPGGTTGRDWIRATLAHRDTGRVPYNFMFSPPARDRVREFYGIQDIEQFFHFPIRMNGPRTTKPLYASPAEFGGTVRDEFGVVWTTSEIDRGSPISPCLPRADLSSYSFPDPAAGYRFEGLDEWHAKNEGNYLVYWVGDLWERATFMRGMENMLSDLMLEPAFVEELLRRLADHIIVTIDILCERVAFDGIALSDDYGAQQGMLMSPAAWRRSIKPVLGEIYARAKRHGKTVFHHSCGNILPIIGDLIDMGLDILHPIQPEAMDIHLLKREFGGALTFCGGLRTQDLLCRGTPADVREEVKRLRETMGGGGGYILEPGITIQADVPVENITAMLEESTR